MTLYEKVDSGGIWLLCNDGVSITVLESHKQYIHFHMNYKQVSTLATVVYTSPVPGVRKLLWAEVSNPWVLGGLGASLA